MKIKGYRKLLVFAVILVIATTLLAWGKLSGAEWVDVTKWVSGFFMGANAASKMTERLTIVPKENAP